MLASAHDGIDKARQEVREGDPERTLSGHSSVTTNDGRTVQVVLEFSDNLAETAHPSYFAKTVVLDARDASPVTLDRVFQSEKRAYLALAKQVSKVAGEVDEQGLRPVRANWTAWQTTPEGMVIHFQDYQLGGHGLRTCVVPWSAVRPLLTPYALEVIG